MLFSIQRHAFEFREEKLYPKEAAEEHCAQNRSMLIGYARVSTLDQNLELQIEALTRAGCKKIFEDRISGSRAERPGLTKAQESLREGDTLVVWKLDRLGRSVKNLVDLVGELHKQRVQFRSLTDAIDTGTAFGTLLLPRRGQPGGNGARTHRRTDPRWTRSRSPARPHRRTQTADDRKQDQISKEAAGQWRSAPRRGQQPRSLRPDSLQVDSSLRKLLACSIFRFLMGCPYKIIGDEDY